MRSPEETRRLLVEAATLAFAEHGVENASLLEITRAAGQRNRGAVHYHFGSREGMLVAVVGHFSEAVAERERALIAAARERDDLDSVVRAIVQPAVDLAEQGTLGRAYLRIIAELVEQDPDSIDPAVRTALEQLGGYEAYTLLEQRLPPQDDDVRAERLALMTAFVLRSVADRGRTDERAPAGRTRLPTPAFTANLVAMVVGMLTAPPAGA